MSKQLHKNFTDEQVILLLRSYLDKRIKNNYILSILGIKRRRFFKLLARYKKDPDNFSIRYDRRTINRKIEKEIQKNIIKELNTEKDLIKAKKVPVFLSDKGGYETHQWLNGQISGTVTFTAPLTTGFYEFRLFQNNTWTKLGTSNTVVVSTIDLDTLGLMRRMHWGGNRVARWRDGNIGVYDETSFQYLQNKVLNVWNNVIGGPVGFLESTSTDSPVKIILDFDLVGGPYAGYSDTYWRNYEIYKSEICINPEVFDSYPDNYLSQLYLHEYGHTIGLAHTSDGGLMDYSHGYDMNEIKDPLKKVVYALYRQPIGSQIAVVLSSEEDLPPEGHMHFEYPLK